MNESWSLGFRVFLGIFFGPFSDESNIGIRLLASLKVKNIMMSYKKRMLVHWGIQRFETLPDIKMGHPLPLSQNVTLLKYEIYH